MAHRPMSDIIQGQNLLAFSPDATVQDACRAMHSRRVGAVVIIDENRRLLGIFTGRDAVRCLSECADPASTTLTQVMTREPHALPPSAKAIEALRLMRGAGFRHVPVVHEGAVTGIVSREDFRGLEHDRLEEEIGLWERI